jgi:hypothetical protein
MVSIAPNLFQIKGEVLSKKKDASLDHFFTINILLEEVEHLQGPSQFLDASQKEIEVNVPEELAARLKKGTQVQCKVRRTPGNFFIVPDSLLLNENM